MLNQQTSCLKVKHAENRFTTKTCQANARQELCNYERLQSSKLKHRCQPCPPDINPSRHTLSESRPHRLDALDSSRRASRTKSSSHASLGSFQLFCDVPLLWCYQRFVRRWSRFQISKFSCLCHVSSEDHQNR